MMMIQDMYFANYLAAKDDILKGFIRNETIYVYMFRLSVAEKDKLKKKKLHSVTDNTDALLAHQNMD